MLTISRIPKKYIWRITSVKNIATLHAITSLTVNSVTDMFLQILEHILSITIHIRLGYIFF